MNKLKKNDSVIYLHKDPTFHINRILNNKIGPHSYIKNALYPMGTSTIKHKTIMSKLIHTMYYTEIKRSAFEEALNYQFNKSMEAIKRSMRVATGIDV